MADDSSSHEFEKLDDRLNYLETVARETVTRLYAIEKHLGLVSRGLPRQMETPAQTRREDQLTRLRAVEDSLTGSTSSAEPQAQETKPASQPPRPVNQPSAPPPVPPVTSSPPAQPPARDRRPSAAPVPPGPPPIGPGIAPNTISLRGDLEARIGGSWFNRIGIIAIFLGVTFFLKYAVDREWIGPAGRVSIGAAIGLAFLILGERLRRRYPSYAYGLTGGGTAILYAAIWFASANKYGLLSQPVAFALMTIVTATASLLAARYSALPIAVLGLIGGFLTPILLSTGVDNQVGFFIYVAVLDLGVLALAYSKQWRSLNYLAFISTVFMFAGWLDEWYEPQKLWTTIGFLTLFFAIFALLAVFYNVINRRATRWLDLTMVFANALLYFGTTYSLLDDQYHGMLGLFALLVAAFYLGLGYFTYRRDSQDRLLVFTFLGLGFLFSVLAVPIQFDQHWVTMGWAIEGAVMTWIGLRANDRTSRNGALLVFGIAFWHWVIVDVPDFAYGAGSDFVPLFNRRALSCAVLVAALAAATFFYKRYGEGIEKRSSFAGFLTLCANALAVTLLTIDANDYFEQRKWLASSGDYVTSLGNTHALMLTGLWTIYGVGVLFAGIVRKLIPLRFLGLLLLSGATIKVLVVDLSYYNSSLHSLVFNQTFAAIALVIGALAAAAWFYAKAEDLEGNERRIVVGVLIAAANLLAVVGLSAEAVGYFDRAQAIAFGEAISQLENTKQFALSVVWTIFGATALIVGIRRGSPSVRGGALLLLALAASKVTTIDLLYYNAGWHTLLLNPTFAAFVLLVLAFASGVWFYARAESVNERERGVLVSVLLAGANILAIGALSAEAMGHFDRARALVGNTDQLADLKLAQQLSISVVWTIYGGVMLTVGIARRSKLLRVMALLLLGLTIFKVFLIDLSSLEKLYRIMSFIVLGMILLAVSFLYQHYRQRLAELIGDGDAAAPVASEQ